MSTERPAQPFLARMIRKLALLVILAWVALTLAVTLGVPSLEHVGQAHAVQLTPKDAPSVVAMMRMGRDFKESDSDSFAMVVLEGQQRLGDNAHAYYTGLVRALRDDSKHVEHVQDLWSDRVTAAGAESADGKAAYVQLNLAGSQGTTLGQESVAAVRNILKRMPPPPGIQTYLTGPAALVTDMQRSGDKSILKITVVSVAIIFTMLLLVYRSVITVVLLLGMVGIELGAARGIVAFLANNNWLALSTFSINLLVALGIAVGTDYGIFFVGRYQEARQAGEDRETAYYNTYRGVAPVVLASGLTIAGALLCLSLTRLPFFQTIGVPCALGMFVAVAVALTLIPAVLTVASRFGLLDPRRRIGVRRWRRIGTAIVRWPAPILATTIAIALIGLATLPGYKTSYNDRLYIPQDIPANQGYAAADRHFSQARMMPEILMIESNHDMRNPADFLVLNKLAKGIFHVPGISRVQGITRPEGTPIEHTSIPFVISLQNAGMMQNMHFMRGSVDQMLLQADLITSQIAIMKHMYDLQVELTNTTHDSILLTEEMARVIDELRGHIGDFEDVWRPVRVYLTWERHCYDIPVCWAFKQIFDSIDIVDAESDKLHDLVREMKKVDALLPQLNALIPPMISIMQDMRTMVLTMHSTMSGFVGQMDEAAQNVTAMGQAFDASKNDDTFYLPPEVFKNEDFQRAMGSFLSPDGKAARFIILHRGDPATPEGVARIDKIKNAAEEALKTTPLEDAKIYIAGTASTYKDFRDGSKYDLLIAGLVRSVLFSSSCSSSREVWWPHW